MRLDQVCSKVLQYCVYSGWLEPHDVLNLACSSSLMPYNILGDECAKDKLRALCGLQVCIEKHFAGAVERLLRTGSQFETQHYVALFLWAARHEHIALMCWLGNSGRFNINEPYPKTLRWLAKMKLTSVFNSLYPFWSYDLDSSDNLDMFYRNDFHYLELSRYRTKQLPLTLLTCAFVCIAHQKATTWKELCGPKVETFTLNVLALITIVGAEPSANKNFMLKNSASFGFTEIVESLITPETPQEDLDVALVDYCLDTSNNLEMTRLLIDMGADPSYKQSRALTICATNGYLNLAMLLLEDPRVDPNCVFHDGFELGYGYTRRRYSILRNYMRDARFDPNQIADDVLASIYDRVG